MAKRNIAAYEQVRVFLTSRLAKLNISKEKIRKHIRTIYDNKDEAAVRAAVEALAPNSYWGSSRPPEIAPSVVPREEWLSRIRLILDIKPEVLLDYGLRKAGSPKGAVVANYELKKTKIKLAKIVDDACMQSYEPRIQQKLKLFIVYGNPSEPDLKRALKLLAPNREWHEVAKHVSRGRPKKTLEDLYNELLREAKTKGDVFFYAPAPGKRVERNRLTVPKSIEEAIAGATSFQLTATMRKNFEDYIKGSTLEDQRTRNALQKLNPNLHWYRDLKFNNAHVNHKSLEDKYLEVKKSSLREEEYYSAKVEVERIKNQVDEEYWAACKNQNEVLPGFNAARPPAQAAPLSNGAENAEQATEQATLKATEKAPPPVVSKPPKPVTTEAKASLPPSTQAQSAQTSSANPEYDFVVKNWEKASFTVSSPNVEWIEDRQFNWVKKHSYTEEAVRPKDLLGRMFTLDTTVIRSTCMEIQEVDLTVDPLNKDAKIYGFKLGVAVSALTRTPVLFDTAKGSTHDLKFAESIIAQAWEYGLTHPVFVEDRAFDAKSNRAMCHERHYDYVHMARDSNQKIKDAEHEAMLRIYDNPAVHASDSFQQQFFCVTEVAIEETHYSTAKAKPKLPTTKKQAEVRQLLEEGIVLDIYSDDEKRALATHLETCKTASALVEFDGQKYLNLSHGSAKNDSWKRYYRVNPKAKVRLVTVVDLPLALSKMSYSLRLLNKRCSEINNRLRANPKAFDFSKVPSTYMLKTGKTEDGKEHKFYVVDRNKLATLLTQACYTLVTNLDIPDLDLNTELGRLRYCEIAFFIYSLRWDSENVNKENKSGCDTISFSSRTPESAAAKLLVMLASQINTRLEWHVASQHQSSNGVTPTIAQINKLKHSLVAPSNGKGLLDTPIESKAAKQMLNMYGMHFPFKGEMAQVKSAFDR